MFRYLIHSPSPFNQIHIKKFIIPAGGCLENRNDCLASLQFSSQNLPLSLERVVYCTCTTCIHVWCTAHFQNQNQMRRINIR